MNTKSAFIAQELAAMNNPDDKTVLVRINVTEEHMEENIKNTFDIVKSMGRELDITFTSSCDPELLNACN